MFEGFDFGSLKEGAVVADIGGGVGSVSVMLAKAHPKLKFVIEDRPTEIEQAKPVCTLALSMLISF